MAEVDWHVHIVTWRCRTTVSIGKKTQDGRVYEIQLCPTVSLSVWLAKEEWEKYGSHHIFGTIQVKNEQDFDELWNAISNILEKRKDMHLLGEHP